MFFLLQAHFTDFLVDHARLTPGSLVVKNYDKTYHTCNVQVMPKLSTSEDFNSAYITVTFIHMYIFSSLMLKLLVRLWHLSELSMTDDHYVSY